MIPGLNSQSWGGTLFDPATLPLTGWWRGDGNTGYAIGGGVATWLAVASAGSSGSNGNMTQATGSLQPSLSLLNGEHWFPDAVDDELDNANTLDTFINNNAFTFSMLVYPTAASADAGANNRWLNNMLVSDAAGWAGVSFSTNGMHVFGYGAGVTHELTIACGTGGWHCLQGTFNGSFIRGRVDSGGFSQTATNATTITTLTNAIGAFTRPGTAQHFNGGIAELMIADSVLSDEQLDGIKSYYNRRGALTL